jgi:O-antigen/teichoic acid export membrane protein
MTRLGRGWSGGGLPFFRDLALLSGGELASKLIGFLAFAVLARRLAPEDYGTVEYIVGLTVFFATLVDCGLGTVGVRRIARDADVLPGLAVQVPAMRLAIALFSVPLMVLVAGPATHGPAPQGLVWLFALSLLAAPWRQLWLLQATERMGEAAVAQILRTLVFAFVVLALVRGPADMLRVGWAEIGAVTAMSLYCVAVQHTRITPWRLRAPVGGLMGLLHEGALVGLGNLVWTANQYAPLLLVASLMGGDETAWFAGGSRIVGSLLIFSNLYHFNLYPAIARAGATARGELANTLAASFRVAAWGGTFVALALTVLAEPLCVLVFGSRFGPAAPMLMILAWVLPIALLSGHARWSLVAAGTQSRVVYAQLSGSLALIVPGIPLVLALGGRGAALAAVAASVAVWLVSHTLAVHAAAPMPAFAMALAPGALAALIIGAIHVLGRHDWSNGVGVLGFALLAPLVDRRLLPAVTRLGVVRLDRSAVAESPA